MWLRRYIEELGSILLKWKGSGKHIQLTPREVKLYELTFPEEMEDRVLEIMQPGFYDNFPEKIMHFIRGLTGIKKKTIEKALKKKGLEHPYVAVHLLGKKKDKRNAKGVEEI